MLHIKTAKPDKVQSRMKYKVILNDSPKKLSQFLRTKSACINTAILAAIH